MKLEKPVTLLWACLLGFLLGVAGVACLATAFEMAVDIKTIALYCGVAAVVSGVCYTLPLGAAPLAIGACALGYLWQNGSLLACIEALLNRLSRQYHRAYGWEPIRWSNRSVEDMELLLTPALCIVGVIVVITAVWAVCRRKSTIPAVALSLLTVAPCLVVTDTIPAEPWLFGYLLCVTVLALTNTVRRQDARQGNRLTAWITLPVALCLLILLAVFPQENYSQQQTAQQLADAVVNMEPIRSIMARFTETGTTGSVIGGDTVDLRTVGVRISSQAEVLRVYSEYGQALYLRGRALDTYDGVSWTSSGKTASQLSWPTNAPGEPTVEVAITTRYAHSMLYLPYNTVSRDLQYLTLGLDNEKKMSNYSFTCQRLPDKYFFSLLYPTEYTWVYANPEELRSYTYLSDSVRQWAEPLAEQLTGNITSHYHKAQAIGDYVRQSAAYDTKTHRMPSNQPDFARWFLEESETGYCVHFATAATVLLQAAGIPARYVTGYMVDMTDSASVVVRGENAHAWAEYWLPGYGWTVLEATPAAQPETTDPTQTTAPEETTQPEQTLPPEQTQPQIRPQEKPTIGEKTVDLTALWMILAVAALAGAAEGQRRLRLYLRQRCLDRLDTNGQALYLWRQTARLAQLLGEPPAAELFVLAEMAKFSQHKLTPAQVAQFEGYILQAKRRLKKRPLAHRIWYRLVLVVY